MIDAVETDDSSQAPAGTDRKARAGRAARGRRSLLAAGVVVLAVGLALVIVPGKRPIGSAQPAQVLPEVPVTAMNLQAKPSNNSPMLAVDPTDRRFVAVASRRDAPFGCDLQVSGDAGRSFVQADPVPELPEGADTCYAPELAFDRTGRLHLLFVGLAGAGNSPVGAYLVTSTDRGRTFSRPQQVLGRQRYMVRMAVDDTMGKAGRIHLVWLEARSDPPLGGLGPPPNPVMAAYSDDGGRSFSIPVQVSDPDRQRVVAPALALGPDHSVHVAYYDLESDSRDYQGLEGPAWEDAWTLVAATSTDGGRTFRPGSVIDRDIVPPGRVMLIFTMAPAALVTGGDGALYAGWHDARNGDWDVFLRRSGDGGRSWGPLRRVNDDAERNGRHQYLPRLAVAPTGRLDAVFYDRRGNVENRGNDVSYTSSTDGGASFAPNQTLTSLDSDSQIGPRYLVASARGLFEFGSRIALVAERDRAVAAWTDTRNTGRGAPSQDIFATQVDLPVSTSSGSPRPVLGLLLAAAGLVVLAARWRYRSGSRGRAAAGGMESVGRPPDRGARPLLSLARRQGLLGAALVVGVPLLGACASDAPRVSEAAGLPLPPTPPQVDIVMREMAFEHPDHLPEGRVVFTARNAGEGAHRLILVPLSEDFPPIAEQLVGSGRSIVDPIAGIPNRPPGATGTFAVDLRPGRYALLCLVVDPDGISHARKGMASELRVP